MTPKQAAQLLTEAFGEDYTAKHTLLERIRGGMVKAVARYSTRNGRSDRIELTEIPPDHWQHVDTADIFWTTGDLTYRMREYGSFDMMAFRQFDVRFEPEAVRAIVGSALKSSDDTTAEETQKGLPVSDAHLKAWYALFRQTHQGSADTLENAYKSAAGMFPGKFVSRQKVRDLAGGRKRGRKLGSEN